MGRRPNEEPAFRVITEEEILGKKSVSLATHCVEARYEEYREAWHLLHDKPEAEGGTIDIQACVVEEFSSATHD